MQKSYKGVKFSHRCEGITVSRHMRRAVCVGRGGPDGLSLPQGMPDLSVSVGLGVQPYPPSFTTLRAPHSLSAEPPPQHDPDEGSPGELCRA